VSTANLDGETNLKLKAAPTASQQLLSRCPRPGADPDPQSNLFDLSGEIRTEPPNSNIHDFSGSMQVEGFASESLGAKQLLMRGTVLRNTALCLGIVVYTGPDTRMVRNSRPAPLKQSNLEKITNVAMGIILVAQLLFALGTAMLHVKMTPQLKGHWYLYPSEILLPELFGWWLTFVTLYSNLMPISLYPTAEFCNAFQCYFIRNDKHMYYKRPDFNNGTGFGASARSSNLCQELGQVGFMFSDKTGTLTQNDMELKRLSIAGRRYGTFEGTGKSGGFNGGPDLQAARQGAGGKAIDAFLEALAVSHTVMATYGSDGKLCYEAESPDEYALVAAVAEQGWAFQGRRGNELTVQHMHPGSSSSQEIKYHVLASNAFNSARKRMSVVVQRGSEYLLLVKGADNVMMERAAAPDKKLEEDLKEFSVQGLRTLVIGCRSLTKMEVDAWKAKYDWAQRETEERDRKLEDVAEEIEKSLNILGATAIEDKLQDGVPETIEKIRFAGIKLWVLTGDKLETARNIGFSTKVLTQDMDLRIVDDEEGTLDLNEIESEWDHIWDPAQKAMMITGKALTAIMQDEDERAKLLSVSTSCSVLIACRVSPSQKAELVRFIREGIQPQPVTLAVGDGANDVPMIQEAQVGVGIAGREGRQAVNNSDFAIAQFRYLQRLMLVHGRWNYRRACKFTLFTFWRNMVQVLMIMYYTLMSGYSGTSLYEDWIRLSFNLLCTLPILAIGCMDEDVPASTALAHPELYSVGRLGKDLNKKKTAFTITAAIAHSLVLYFLTIPAFPGMELFGTGDYYTFGTTCYTCLLLDVNYRAGFITNTHNVYTIGSIVLSFALYIFWLIAYPQNPWLADKLAPNMYMVPEHMVASPYFWICVIAVPLFAMMIDVYISFNHHHFLPDVRDRVTYHGNKAGQQDAACPADLAGLVSENSDDEPSSVIRSESDSDGGVQYDPADTKQIDLSDFAQQRIWTHRIRHARPYLSVVYTGIMAGTVLLAMGLVALYYSESCDQIRVQYAESPERELDFMSGLWSHFPMGTRSYEKARANCSATIGGEQLCHASVLLKNGMRKPLLYYALGPFYQNYNSYMKSEVMAELTGKEVSQSQREKSCVLQTRVDSAGRQIVPCGMKATSVFNDTFEVVGYDLVFHDIAWKSDVQRYNNPPDYPSRPDTSWLYQRYPETIKKEEGVKTHAFADWMRPSAVPRVWNRYGYLNEHFGPGAVLELKIRSRYPMDTIPGGYKVIVLTEYGAFGARHSGFGYILISAGALCFLLAMIACATYRSCPQGLPWLQRLLGGEDSDEGYESDAKSEESP